MLIHLFGSTNPSGQAFIRYFEKEFKEINIIKYSRNNKKYEYLDFNNYKSFNPLIKKDLCLWVNFGPIWLFSEFLKNIYENKVEFTKNIKGIITCSSSSVVTKRFSNNNFDKQLYKKLKISENQILNISRRLNIKVTIIRPSLIYGKIGNYKDKNISKIIKILRIFPIIPIPKKSGLRQPIHASQLARIFLDYITNFYYNFNDLPHQEKVEVGGNSIISYEEMIILIKENLPKNDLGRICYLLPIPNRIFNLFASPLIILSPKFYASILRLSADLSGFKKSSSYKYGSLKENFPILPLPK